MPNTQLSCLRYTADAKPRMSNTANAKGDFMLYWQHRQLPLCHKHVWGSGVIAPWTLNFDTRGQCLLHPLGNAPPLPTGQEAGWVSTAACMREEETVPASAGNWTPVVQPAFWSLHWPSYIGCHIGCHIGLQPTNSAKRVKPNTTVWSRKSSK
jgi:hypothetical protein